MARKGSGGDPPVRGRGRPVGGGNSAQQAQKQLLDASERLFLERGFSATTMEAIAGEAGYSRAVVYRHFRSRDDLMDALVVRTTMTEIAAMAGRLILLQDLAEIIVESLTIVATEVGANPLLRLLASSGNGMGVASLIVNAPNLIDLLTSMYTGLFNAKLAQFRDGLRPEDAARYVLSVALGLLMGLVPGSDDPKQVRRYVQVFVLPCLLSEPPAPVPVFD